MRTRSYHAYSPKLYQQEPNKIKNIVFDFGGVILDCPFQTFTQQTFPHLLNDQNQLLSDLIFSSDLWFQYDKGLCYTKLRRELCVLINSQLNFLRCNESDVDQLIVNIKKFLLPNPNMVALVNDLKKVGYSLYGLTNMPREILDHLFKTHAVFQQLSGTVASSVLGVGKPEKAIYLHLLQSYNLDPQETVFLDDRAINLVEAKQLGMATLHFSNAETAKAILQNKYAVSMHTETEEMRSTCSPAL